MQPPLGYSEDDDPDDDPDDVGDGDDVGDELSTAEMDAGTTAEMEDEGGGASADAAPTQPPQATSNGKTDGGFECPH